MGQLRKKGVIPNISKISIEGKVARPKARIR